LKTHSTYLGIILALLVALTLSWAVPITQAFEPRDYSIQGGHIEPWTLERGIEYLEWARDNHQFYVDYPDRTNGSTGDVDFNGKCVSEYTQLIKLLEGISYE